MAHWINQLRALFHHRRPADTAVRDMLQAQYYNFKSLLNLNERALLDMSDLEQKLSTGRAFGMPFVRSRATSMSVQVYQIIETLNRMSDGRHRDLFRIFDALQADINRLLADNADRAEGPLVVSMQQVSKKDAGLVGPKMAVLGEIKHRIHPLVPDGFAITTVAARLFMAQEGLCARINQMYQATDHEDVAQVQKTSRRIRRLITETPLPPELEAAIGDACARLRHQPFGNAGLMAVRSSALGEDTPEHSFAGLYDTELNVPAADVPQVYRRILASKYTARAMAYREQHGLRSEQIHMGVGCLAMVPAAAGGVIYSRDPAAPGAERLIINAAAGQGRGVVDGRVSPEHVVVATAADGRWRIDRSPPPEAPARDGARVPQEVILKLAALARRLEKHFQSPQDIEWALTAAGDVYLLQSRPLHLSDGMTAEEKDAAHQQPDTLPLLKGGQTASRGVGWGVARVMKTREDMQTFATGDVLVVEHPLPRWTELLTKAAAMVADSGGVVGHLATVAREFAVPAVVATGNATRAIPPGSVITVDADHQAIYSGKVEMLIEGGAVKRPTPFSSSPVYRTLQQVMKMITPLNLLDPTDARFQSTNCGTYHDIVRFCHETAIEELFAFSSRHGARRYAGKKLVADTMPVRLWVMRLDDESVPSTQRRRVRLEEIDSRPFQAFCAGVMAVPWEGPPAPDAKGFLSVMAESTMKPELEAAVPSPVMARNRAFVAQNFCNISLRWGYHLSVTQAFWGATPRENHARFSFQGGGADHTRRDLRVRLIAGVLEKYGFQVRTLEDHISAQLDGFEGDDFGNRIKLIGYINIHACQLDMVLGDSTRARHFREKMHADIEKTIFRC